MKKVFLVSFVLTMMSVAVWGQQSLGMPGLIHVPTADMDSAGIARIGAQYVPKEIVPDRMTCDGEKFNSFTNYLSITLFRWIEVSYGYTLWKMHKNKNPNEKTGFYSRDRYVSLRLQPIQEAKWWPSVVVGAIDLWGSHDGGISASNHYRNYYLALSKHLEWHGYRFGGHMAYRYWKRDFNHKWNGVVGGVTAEMAFYRPLRFMAEWDGNEVNIGADCRLFKLFLLQCGLVDMRHFTGGLSLYIDLF
ncbi:MAG: YjbH domain-containing protein [Prevotella sp.]|nr:YjbH domain-containing protein [Prevotella sp.]MBR3080970.1 YjbH domain-containing protein [Prevotella sp.]